MGSVSTLICCVLPFTLVSLGMGAAMASLATQYPSLVWISEHKLEVFGLSAILIVISALTVWWNRNMPCPVDPDLRAACLSGRKWSVRFLLFATAIYSVGFFFAFLR